MSTDRSDMGEAQPAQRLSPRALRVEEDRLKFFRSCESYILTDISPEMYACLFAQGDFPIEQPGEFVVQRPAYHEVVPVALHLPHGGARRAINSGIFSLTTNCHFDQVVDVCALSRDADDPDVRWMRDKSKENLRALHHIGAAHSIEIYNGPTLAGGLIGLQVRGVFVSLSAFHRVNHAGSAAFFALQAILCKHRFAIHNAVTPSNSSTALHGRLISKQEYFIEYRKALRDFEPPVFPDYATPQSLKEYMAPLRQQPGSRPRALLAGKGPTWTM